MKPMAVACHIGANGRVSPVSPCRRYRHRTVRIGKVSVATSIVAKNGRRETRRSPETTSERSTSCNVHQRRPIEMATPTTPVHPSRARLAVAGAGKLDEVEDFFDEVAEYGGVWRS